MIGAFHLPGAVLQYSREAYQYAGGILGLGARAYSFTGARLCQASADPRQYIEDVSAGRLAQRCSGDLSDLDLLIRSTMLSLMYGEIRAGQIARWHERRQACEFEQATTTWQEQGWAFGHPTQDRAGAFQEGLRLSPQGAARADDLLNFFWSIR